MPIEPDNRIVPGSPYGESKFFLERTLYWFERIYGLKYACLRYFDASGDTPDRGGRGKRWLARCPEPPLDAAIVGRTKTGFGLPMAEWLSALAPPIASRAALPGRGVAGAPDEAWARRWARRVAAEWLA